MRVRPNTQGCVHIENVLVIKSPARLGRAETSPDRLRQENRLRHRSDS